jgi:hypothetical protein
MAEKQLLYRGCGLMLRETIRCRFAASGSAASRRFIVPFTSEPPNISIEQYIARIDGYFNDKEGCLSLLPLTMTYLDRVLTSLDCAIDYSNIYRLFLACAVLAYRWLEDDRYSEDACCRVGGVVTRNMRTIVAKTLKALDWRCFVAPEIFELNRRLILQRGATQMETTLTQVVTRHSTSSPSFGVYHYASEPNECAGNCVEDGVEHPPRSVACKLMRIQERLHIVAARP